MDENQTSKISPEREAAAFRDRLAKRQAEKDAAIQEVMDRGSRVERCRTLLTQAQAELPDGDHGEWQWAVQNLGDHIALALDACDVLLVDQP